MRLLVTFIIAFYFSSCTISRNYSIEFHDNSFVAIFCCGDDYINRGIDIFSGIRIQSPDSIDYNLLVHSYEIIIKRDEKIIQKWKLKGGGFNKKVRYFFKENLQEGDKIEINQIIGLTPDKKRVLVNGFYYVIK